VKADCFTRYLVLSQAVWMQNISIIVFNYMNCNTQHCTQMFERSTGIVYFSMYTCQSCI